MTSVQPFRGAAVIGQGPRWLILLTEVRQTRHGSWVYTYSIAPGRQVSFVTWPRPGMIGPYDDTFAGLCAGYAAAIGDGA